MTKGAASIVRLVMTLQNAAPFILLYKTYTQLNAYITKNCKHAIPDIKIKFAWPYHIHHTGGWLMNNYNLSNDILSNVQITASKLFDF